MTELERARQQIDFAHGYTLRLLAGVEPDDWFRIPSAGVTHIAWQVGHLTFAEYRLALFRLRGRLPEDSELMSQDFLQIFAARTTPDPDRSHHPTTAAIRETYERVHARALQEIAAFDPARVDEPIDPPHEIAKTKLDSLFWCAAHEMLHAGQIGLLRRQLGHRPLW